MTNEMNSNLSTDKKRIMLVSVGMIVFGLLFALAGVFFILQPQDTMLEATATITDIASEYDVANETYEYEVSVEYTDANGNKQEAVTGAYNSGMNIGDTIQIEYDSEHPEIISTPGSEVVPYIFVGVGAIMACFGVIKAIKGNKKEA